MVKRVTPRARAARSTPLLTMNNRERKQLFDQYLGADTAASYSANDPSTQPDALSHEC